MEKERRLAGEWWPEVVVARSNPAAAREDAAGGDGLGYREEKPSRRGPEAGWVRSPEIAQMGFLGSVFGSVTTTEN